MNKRGNLLTPLQWTGGKRHHVEYVEPIWSKHSHRRMIEPFAGGLAISFSFNCNKVLANDINKNLINFYQCIQKDPIIDIDMLNEEEYYYNCREEFNSNIVNYPDILTAPETIRRRHGELFYYLNRHSFNGLYRENSSGAMNAPYGKNKNAYGLKDLSYYKEKIKDWEFVSGDFSAIKLNNNEDIIFADPPYLTDFTSYNKAGFNWLDQIRVCEWLRDFTGPVMICNQRIPETEVLYREYGYNLIETRRRNNFKGKTSDESKQEIMAVKNV